MEVERLQLFIGNETMKIVDAMEKIDRNANRILFVVDCKGMLSGCITDGDVRRWLLKAGELSAPVSLVMSKSPKFLFEDEKSKAESIMRKYKITALPILDSSRDIIDIVLFDDIERSVSKKRKNLANVPVVVMAGGRGTRLYPYTKILPKPLIPIGDTPIIERIINEFLGYGLNKFYITVNYKKGMIKSYFGDLNPTYQIEYVDETMPLGTAGGIKLIEDRFLTPFFVINSDALILADYSDLYEHHKKTGNDITVVSALKNITVPYGVLNIKDAGEIESMEEKPRLSYFINTGMYIINPNLINFIPNNQMYHMTQLVDDVMKKGGKVGMYPISEDSFLDMGKMSEMRRMEEKLNIVSD